MYVDHNYAQQPPSNSYNPGVYGQPTYGQPTYGQPASGQPFYGQNFDAYVQMDDRGSQNKRLSSSLYGRGRVRFIQKVYTILSMQMVITAAVTLLTIYNESFLRFQAENTWAMILALVGMIVSEVYILCCEQGREYPTNMVLLGVFTLCESYFVSYICGVTSVVAGKQTVLIAAGMTVVIVVVCTIYAFTTETDFTTSWGILLVLSAAVLCLGIVTMFTSSPFLRNLYCALGVVLFGIYLIVDTQMLLGGRTIELTVDDYVLASFCLYVDIIQIFLYLLELLRGNNNE